MYKTILKNAPNTELPSLEEVVLGYDEQNKEEVIVRYRRDSNRFFDEPYTGSVFPIRRMNKWRKQNSIPKGWEEL